MTESALHEAPLVIPASHPALPGHFPGRPIVPGVVLLDCVLDEAQRWLGRGVCVRSLPHAKFSSPLLPGEHARIELKLSGQELRFSVIRESEVLAQGMFELETGTDA